MSTLLRSVLSLLILASLCAPRRAAAEEPVARKLPAFNQRTVSGNACGPVALLNALRFGDAFWQNGLKGVEGDTDRQRLAFVIRAYGGKPSTRLAGRPRWSPAGINLADLNDLADDLLVPCGLPALKSDTLVPDNGQDPRKFLKSTHRRLAASLERGFPPIISLRRFVWRKTAGGQPAWLATEAHYVTVTRIQDDLPRGDRSFTVTYLDPNGGRRCSGTLRLPDAPSPPGLVAAFPATPVGRKNLKDGETTVLVLSAVLGRW
jgi:hypothetical protein